MKDLQQFFSILLVEIVHDFKNNSYMAWKKKDVCFAKKPHQIIKDRFVKAYLYFSTILIYKTTTTNINSSEYIMLEKTFSFIMA